MKKITASKIVKVRFILPVGQGIPQESYFGSLSAIFEVFTPEQIGCTLKTLWASKIDVDKPKATNKCVISKHYIYRKQQTIQDL